MLPFQLDNFRTILTIQRSECLHPDIQQYQKCDLIKNVEDIVETCLILIISPMLLKRKNCAIHFPRKNANEN